MYYYGLILLFSEDMNAKSIEVNLPKFLKTDLRNKIILNVKIPPLNSKHLIRTYKVGKYYASSQYIEIHFHTYI